VLANLSHNRIVTHGGSHINLTWPPALVWAAR
jgi:hypothetical protein